MTLDAEPATSSTETGPRFSLDLLGSIGLRLLDGTPVPGLGPGKSLAILAYLAVRGDTRREELINLLWGDTAESNARNAFRQSLHRLRSALGEEVLPQHRDQVAIADPYVIRVDRDAFLDACENGFWDVAVATYRGHFLEGFETGEQAFDRWADGERVRLQARFREALLAAGRQATAEGDLREALSFAERLSALAPYDEAGALFEANTLIATGRATQALAMLRQFSARLSEELDLSAPPAIGALIQRLEKRRESPATPEPGSVGRERTKPPTFVGREREISRLVAAVDGLRASGARGATILIEGESGIGKSRLLHELGERTKDLGGVLLLRGRESANGGVVPYASVVDALRPIVRAAGISGASRHLLAEAARVLPELRDSFDLPAIAPVSDETDRLRLFEGIAALIDAAAYEKPVCLVLDDVQHASSSTLDLVSYLSLRLRESPVLLVLALRSDRAAGRPSTSGSADRIRELITNLDGRDLHIVLEPLEPGETAQLVREELRRGGGGEVRDVDRIVARSEGRPLAALELSRRAVLGSLESAPPLGLREILWARLQTASPAQRRVFFAAALFARASSLRLLAAAAHLPQGATSEAVETLVDAGLLVEGSDGYVLAHDSAASFLAESSGLAARAMLAGWAADALAEIDPSADAELATLYAMAGRDEEAFRYARAAAFSAASVGGRAEVVRLLGLALTFAPGETERREVDSLLTAFGRDRLALPSAGSADKQDPGAGSVRADDTPGAEAPPVVSDAAPAVESAVERLVPDEPDVIVEPLDDAAPQTVPAKSARATARQWVASIAVSIILISLVRPAQRAIMSRLHSGAVPDTLFVLERDANGANQLRAIVDPEHSRNPTLVAPAPNALGPAWVDSLSVPYTDPLVSPSGDRVAIERVTQNGGEVLVVSADRRDTVAVTPPSQDNDVLGWSPDGRALLVSRTRTLGDGSIDSDLYIIWLTPGLAPIAIDTAASRAIVQATWAPTGEWVAWVARALPNRQREIFIAHPDGTGMRAIAPDSADNYDIDWSPDGSLLAFTSTRSGGHRLFVYDFDEARLWPISDRADEDDPHFSPDGRSIAFESTRDGDRAIYERAALGGTARRLTPVSRQMSVDAWRGPSMAYLDRVRVLGSASVGVRDTAALGLLALASNGTTMLNVPVQFKALDSSLTIADTGHGAAVRVVGREAGIGRIVAVVPGWRSDTLTVAVSSNQSVHMSESFAAPALPSEWLALGQPAPYVGNAPGAQGRALYPNGDLEWDSGVLLQPTLQLRDGLHVQARVFAPFNGLPTAARLTVALVSAVAPTTISRSAPQLNSIVGVVWDSPSGALTYSVGQESASDQTASLTRAESHLISISVLHGIVKFSVDGAVRWSSSLKYAGAGSATPVQLWIGGHATGSAVAVSDVAIDVSSGARGG